MKLEYAGGGISMSQIADNTNIREHILGAEGA